MIDQFADVEDDIALPSTPLDLSQRIRDLRTQQGLKQSEIARRMGLDPSIPSLWEQGKRPVPSSRVRALAEALGVTLPELLDGVPGAAAAESEALGRQAVASGLLAAERGIRERTGLEDVPLATLVQSTDEAEGVEGEGADEELVIPPPRWVPAERPALVGWIPDGWGPGDRVQDISPSLPDGYWLDPVKLERSSAKQLLRSRLCPADQKVVGDRDVPGAALAERIWQHCSKESGFTSGKLPLAEAIVRAVLASEYGGLPTDALIDALRERSSGVPLSATLLRRMGDSVRGYPVRWVDRELFR